MHNFDIHNWRQEHLFEELNPDSKISVVKPWREFKSWIYKQQEKLKYAWERAISVYNQPYFGGLKSAIDTFFDEILIQFGALGVAVMIGGPVAAFMVTLFKIYSLINRTGKGGLIKIFPVLCPACKKGFLNPETGRCNNCDFWSRNNESAITELPSPLLTEEEKIDYFKDAMKSEVAKFKALGEAIAKLSEKYPEIGIKIQKEMMANVISKLPSSSEDFKSKLIKGLSSASGEVDETLLSDIESKINQL